MMFFAGLVVGFLLALLVLAVAEKWVYPKIDRMLDRDL